MQYCFPALRGNLRIALWTYSTKNKNFLSIFVNNTYSLRGYTCYLKFISNLPICHSALVSSPKASTYFRISSFVTLNLVLSLFQDRFRVFFCFPLGVSRKTCSLDLRLWIKTFQGDGKGTFQGDKKRTSHRSKKRIDLKVICKSYFTLQVFI